MQSVKPEVFYQRRQNIPLRKPIQVSGTDSALDETLEQRAPGSGTQELQTEI